MKANIQSHSVGRPARLLICVALALAITAVTTQVIIRSASQHEYAVAGTATLPDGAASAASA
jgi:hypothetical protein